MSFKRQADTELNQDNVHEMDKEISDKAKHDTWKRASDDVLASRKILKGSDKFSGSKPVVAVAGGGGGFAAYAKINPFAAMGPPTSFNSTTAKSTPTPTIATKETSNSVPVATVSPKTNPFGASNPAHNPFMNFVGENKPNVDYWQKFKEPVKVPTSEPVSGGDVKVTFCNPSGTNNIQQEGSSSASDDSKNSNAASSSGSDSSSDPPVTGTEIPATESSQDQEKEGQVIDNADSASVISDKRPAIDTAAMFQKPTELSNGEAGEECVLKLRAKLYRLSGEWVEVGTGPVRLLTPAPSGDSGSGPLFPRVVMRREHHQGGPGTKVILNALFRSHFSVAKMGERAARLTCLAVPPEPTKIILPGTDTADSTGSTPAKEESEGGEGAAAVAVPMTFLFKMQHSHEADQFIKHINKFAENIAKEDSSEEKKTDA